MSAALVLLMTGPGPALFYSGLVRQKNAKRPCSFAETSWKRLQLLLQRGKMAGPGNPRLPPCPLVYFQRIQPDRFHGIRSVLPSSEADHLRHRRRHRPRQPHHFAHKKRPCSGLRVQSARRTDLRIPGPLFLSCVRHSNIGAILPVHGACSAGWEYPDRNLKPYAICRRFSTISLPHRVLAGTGPLCDT